MKKIDELRMTNLFLALAYPSFFPETRFHLRPHDPTESSEKLSSDGQFILSISCFSVLCEFPLEALPEQPRKPDSCLPEQPSPTLYAAQPVMSSGITDQEHPNAKFLELIPGA